MNKFLDIESKKQLFKPVRILPKRKQLPKSSKAIPMDQDIWEVYS